MCGTEDEPSAGTFLLAVELEQTLEEELNQYGFAYDASEDRAPIVVTVTKDTHIARLKALIESTLGPGCSAGRQRYSPFPVTLLSL